MSIDGLATVAPPKDGKSRTVTPSRESLLNEATISAVAAARVALIPLVSMKYKLLGITAMGHREATEFVRYGQ